MTRQDASSDALEKPAPRINSPDRSQVDPHPKRIDELIPPGHKARLIWALVEGLDMAPLYAEVKSVEGHAGRPAIDPRILVALWLYATDEGIASAHELARRCTKKGRTRTLPNGATHRTWPLGGSEWGTAEAQEKYRQRCKIEFPNATCRNRGPQRFLVRGLAKVKTVVLWYVLIHNLLRMVALRAQRTNQAA